MCLKTSLNIPVQTHGSDERANKSPGLRMAAGMKQCFPLFRSRKRFFNAAVTQEVRQSHFRIRHVLTDAHLMGNRDAASGLAQVEGSAAGHEREDHQHAGKIHDSRGRGPVRPDREGMMQRSDVSGFIKRWADVINDTSEPQTR